MHSDGKESAMQETRVQSLGQEDPLEKGMATHSKYSCLGSFMVRRAWRATVHGVARVRQTEQLRLALSRWELLVVSISQKIKLRPRVTLLESKGSLALEPELY